MSLQARLLRFLQKRHPQFVAKGELCDIARSVTGATGEHTNRRLRELREDGKLKQELRKGHVFYASVEPYRQLYSLSGL